MENIQTDDKPILKQKSFRKVIILNVGTLLMLVVSLVLLSRVGLLGEEIQKIKNENMTSVQEADVAFLKTELSNYEGKVADLESLFLKNEDIVPFFTEINRLVQEGIASPPKVLSDVTTDGSTGISGYPFSITLTGTKEQVDAALRTLQGLPFLMRGIVTEVISEEASGSAEPIIVLNYGGFIYAE